MLLLSACGGERAVKPQPPPRKILAPMGYTIQIGAFSKMSNAVRLTQKLHIQGVSAYHFLHPSGLYKVRFGNYRSKNLAHKHAEGLQAEGLIGEYYIVGPDEYAAVKLRRYGSSGIRDTIAKTARQYIGVPYKWGGESPQTGFDCSGFTMVVYQLNGLDLPRSSRQQWNAGRPIKRSQLLKGDLVFFATSGRQKVSHVGIYLERGKFLHAPRRGQKIKSADLSDTYFKARYLGARTYL
jgi:cell wall-associated NlpC family hydrolase